MGQENLLRLGGGLHRHPLSLQVLQGIDGAVFPDGHYLTAVHIRLRPTVLVLPAVNGKAAPDAVNGPLLHQLLLVLPDDGLELRLVAHTPKGLPGQLHIDARRRPIRILIIKGRVNVAAHHDLGQFLLILVSPSPQAAAGKQLRQKEGCQRCGKGPRTRAPSVFLLF